MKRREFIAGPAALLVLPRYWRAQGKPRRLGFLAVGDGSGKALNQAELALLDALRSLGWIEEKIWLSSIGFPNLRIDWQLLSPT
jgi:putative ABC transport system substrate-binding protein